MAIIYTYPLMQQTVVADDLLLMTDISDDKKTKSVLISALPFTNNAGTVTSVALTMPAAFAVANSPITTAGTLAVTTTGGASGQYLDYTGNWSTPPSAGSLPIEDEGSQITSAAAKINFTGAGVTASASGNDVTVNIPGSAYVLPLAANGTRGGIQIGYVQNAKNYPVLLSAEKAYVNVPWTDTDTNTTYTLQAEAKSGSSVPLKLDASSGTDSTVNLTEGANVTLTRNSATEVTIAATGGSSGKLGFTPLSIYEATGKIESVSGEEGSALSVIRQSVCETDCTIDKVDFFRLAGTDRVTIAVYTGTIASGAGSLVLLGGQTSGTTNSINTITFSSPHSFSAGDDIIILISLQFATGNDAELLGATNLYSNSALGRENTTFYSNPNSSFETLIEDFSSASTKAGALHFYDE